MTTEATTGARRADAVSRRSLARTRSTGASRKTVLIALTANASIAICKGIAGALTGSAGLLAETAHSIADTGNQIFLLASISLSGREPREERPFGYGQERFLWTFVAAVGMFLAGALFAIGFGIYELIRGDGESSSFGIAYAVLAISFAAEGSSWLRALRQTRREARAAGVGLLTHIRESRDPNVKMVLFEDSAALIGVVLAALGIGLNELTGSLVFDPAASVLIGVLLVSVAMFMGRDAGGLLVGSAARPRERETIERTIAGFEEISDVEELLTLVLGPNAILVAARVDLRDDIPAGRVEEVAGEIDRRLREVVPDVTEVFLDPTRGH